MPHPNPSRPVKVIHVHGDSYEIGRQHGSLVPELSTGMTQFYSSFWQRMLSQSPPRWDHRLVHRIIGKVIDSGLVLRLTANLPDHVRDRIRGLSAASGHSMKRLETSAVLPDLLPILLSLSSRLRPYSVIPVEPPLFGCSSFFARDRSLIHGRNLDFPGVGYWDRFALIQMTQPKHGLRYIGFTTAGVPFCGITGVNEAQVSVSLHQHYGRRFSLLGIPPFVIAEEVLEKATDLDEARNIVARHPVSAAWAFLIGDGKTRDAVLIERSGRATGSLSLSECRNVLTHSNFFQTRECSPDGYATTGRMNWDNYWRKTRLERNILENGVTNESACQYMSEHFDPYWGEEKIINRTVSQVYNIQSLVMDLAEMRVWMAEGDAPIHLRHYAEFDLGEIFAGREGRTGREHCGHIFQDPAKRTAKEAYILSFVASFDGNDSLALERMETALLHGFCAEAAMVAGVLSLKLGHYSRARQLLEEGAVWVEAKLGDRRPPPEYFESLLFLGRTYDLLGEHGKASQTYQRLSQSEDCLDAHLKMLARRKTPYRSDELYRVLTPYSSYIPFE